MTNNNDEICSYDIITQLPSNIKRISANQNGFHTDSYSVEIKNKSISYSSDIFQPDVPIKVLREKIKDDVTVDTHSKGEMSNSSGEKKHNKHMNTVETTKNSSAQKYNYLPKNNHDVGTELTKPGRNKDLYKKHYTINTKIQAPVINGNNESSGETNTDTDTDTDTDTFSCSTYNTVLSGLEDKYKNLVVKNNKKILQIETKKDTPDDESSEEYSITPETIDFVASKIHGSTERKNLDIFFEKKPETHGTKNKEPAVYLSYFANISGECHNNLCTYGQGTYSNDNKHCIEYLVPFDGKIKEFAVKVNTDFFTKNSVRFGIMINGRKMKENIIYVGQHDINNVKNKICTYCNVKKYDTISLYSEQSSLYSEQGFMRNYSLSGFIILSPEN